MKLPYDEKMPAFRFDATDSSGVPLVGVWKSALSEREQKIVHEITGEILKELHYEIPCA